MSNSTKFISVNIYGYLPVPISIVIPSCVAAVDLLLRHGSLSDCLSLHLGGVLPPLARWPDLAARSCFMLSPRCQRAV